FSLSVRIFLCPIRYSHAFRPVMPVTEVDYPRVTHPFAAVLTLAGFLPRLACVRHAASVRSEPGSNSPIINRSVNPKATVAKPPHGGRDWRISLASRG